MSVWVCCDGRGHIVEEQERRPRSQSVQSLVREAAIGARRRRLLLGERGDRRARETSRYLAGVEALVKRLTGWGRGGHAACEGGDGGGGGGGGGRRGGVGGGDGSVQEYRQARWAGEGKKKGDGAAASLCLVCDDLSGMGRGG